jgi:hypothetical protein
MAVTITNTFNDVVALQKPLVLTASSTNTSEPKFRYVMTVDVNSVEVVKVKQQANQNDYVHFDLYQIIKDYFETKYLDGGIEIHKIITTVDGDDTALFIELNVYEEYATSSTTDPTEYPSTGNDTDSFLAINSTFQFTDGVTPTLAGVYEFNNDTTEIQWLTNMPTRLKTRPGEYQTAAILASDFRGAVSTSLRYSITFYEADGTQISTANITRTTIGMANFVATKSAVNAGVLYQFIPIGYQNLEDQSFNTSIRPSTQANLAYYTINIFDNSGDYITKTYRFDIAECSRYTPIQLAWVNSLGAWDYYTFELASLKKLNIQRETFRKPFGNWGAGATYTYSQYESGDTIYKIEADKQYTVNSDWLNDSDFEWLQELLMSKEVQFVNENGDFTPVIITDTDYEFKQDVNNKLNNLQLTFKLGHKIK